MTLLTIDDHDEFLHLGFPKELSSPWKENYYFNYIDKEADALGIFHLSIQRHKGIVTLKSLAVIGGKPMNYVHEMPWPSNNPELLNEQLVMTDGKLSFEVLEPYKKHRILFRDGDTVIHLNYTERFKTYLYNDESFTENSDDKALDVIHYEQGMTVKGEITFNGTTRKINCLGHRDHTWGFRDESNLKSWNWIAIQFKKSTWNFYKLQRNNLPSNDAGFVSFQERNETIISVEVISIEYNEFDEPLVSKYRVTLQNGEIFHLTATRFERMFIPGKDGSHVIHHENFSNFIIDETGEKGVGIDEHMLVIN